MNIAESGVWANRSWERVGLVVGSPSSYFIYIVHILGPCHRKVEDHCSGLLVWFRNSFLSLHQSGCILHQRTYTPDSKSKADCCVKHQSRQIWKFLSGPNTWGVSVWKHWVHPSGCSRGKMGSARWVGKLSFREAWLVVLISLRNA